MVVQSLTKRRARRFIVLYADYVDRIAMLTGHLHTSILLILPVGRQYLCEQVMPTMMTTYFDLI